MPSKIEWVTVEAAPDYEMNRAGLLRRNCEGHMAQKGKFLMPILSQTTIKYSLMVDGLKRQPSIRPMYKKAFGYDFKPSNKWLEVARKMAANHPKRHRLKGRPASTAMLWKWMDFDPWLTYRLQGANEQQATRAQLTPMEWQMVPA